MFPLAVGAVIIPFGDPIPNVPPLVSVNELPVIVLVPILRVAPLFTVKLMVLDTVPPEVNAVVPVKFTAPLAEPVSVMVPAV